MEGQKSISLFRLGLQEQQDLQMYYLSKYYLKEIAPSNLVTFRLENTNL